MYDVWSLIYLGNILIVNSVWRLALFPTVFAIIHFIDIRREEHTLGKVFGDKYIEYPKCVHRYL